MYFAKRIAGVCDVFTNECGSFTIRENDRLNEDWVVMPLCAIPTLIKVLQELYNEAENANELSFVYDDDDDDKQESAEG